MNHLDNEAIEVTVDELTKTLASLTEGYQNIVSLHNDLGNN